MVEFQGRISALELIPHRPGAPPVGIEPAVVRHEISALEQAIAFTTLSSEQRTMYERCIIDHRGRPNDVWLQFELKKSKLLGKRSAVDGDRTQISGPQRGPKRRD